MPTFYTINIERVYMIKQWNALLVDQFTFDEVTIVKVHFSHSCNFWIGFSSYDFTRIFKSIWVQIMVSILREPAGLRASETREPDNKIESHGLAGSL